jgi:hypothetical protein
LGPVLCAAPQAEVDALRAALAAKEAELAATAAALEEADAKVGRA